MKALAGHGAGRVGDRQGAIAAFHDLAAGMEELAVEAAVLGVAALGQAAKAGNAVLLGGHQHVAGIAGGLVHAGDLGDDQPGAALRAGLVIGDQRVVDGAVSR